ncbi:MAG TPA: hypothetical protein VI007_12730 [bacterium]
MREQTVDAKGRPIVPGMKVKVAGENGTQEGTIVRVLHDYGVITVVVPEGRGQVERMVRIVDIEAI